MLATPVSPTGRLALRTLAPCTVTKLGQKPLRQEKSLLQADWSMARLVPSSVSSGDDRHAVRLHAAVAAALAHGRIDEHALVGIGERAALAAAALLGRAGLVVEQHRDAGHLAQLLLHLLQVAAVVDGHAARDEAGRILERLVGDHHHLLDALGQHLLQDHRHGHAAVERLAAGHGDGVVVEDLEGHVHAGRARRADGQAAGVDVGAVAEVLEHVAWSWRTAPRRSSCCPRRPSG